MDKEQLRLCAAGITGEFLDVTALSLPLQAAFFCLASSATFIVNNLLGLLGVLYGALIIAWTVAPSVVLVIAAYITLSFACSFVRSASQCSLYCSCFACEP